MKLKNYIYLGLFLLVALFLGAKTASASEGTVNLKSLTNERYRCFAASLLRQDRKYKIVVSCRDLIYPAGDEIITYIMWATPSSGESSLKLGELGFGKAEFSTATDFSGLFVTTEATKSVKTPTGPTVMSGSVEKIPLLEQIGLTTQPDTTQQATKDSSEEEATELPTPTEEAEESSKLGQAVRRAGLAAVLALLAAIGLVFVLTRGRN